MSISPHGGNIYSPEGHPLKLLDFSASLNPLGMPEEVMEAAKQGIGACVHYPDPMCLALRRAISGVQGVSVENILCGNGAAELLDRLVLALRPKKAMLLAPTFGEYERTLTQNGCQVVHHYLKGAQKFDLQGDILRRLQPNLDLMVLCNPNNPTGRAIPQPLLVEVLERCQRLGCTLLVDESFLDLTDEEQQADLRPFLATCSNLVLLRSLTKSYCMPGLRLGYLLTGNNALLEKMTLCGQPWSVSVPAQLAGVAAMQLCPDWPEKGRKLIQIQRAYLKSSLETLGFQVWESHVNYLLFQAAGQTDLRERLLEEGILIRSCAPFRGLGRDFYRIAVKTKADNQKLIEAIAAINKERQSLWHPTL